MRMLLRAFHLVPIRWDSGIYLSGLAMPRFTKNILASLAQILCWHLNLQFATHSPRGPILPMHHTYPYLALPYPIEDET